MRPRGHETEHKRWKRPTISRWSTWSSSTALGSNQVRQPCQTTKIPSPGSDSTPSTIDLRWTLKDIAGKRPWLINKEHLATLIDLGLVEMREDVPHLTIAGQNAAWKA